MIPINTNNDSRMARLSKAQITRWDAARNGGRGRERQLILEAPVQWQGVKTSQWPKTTAWRYSHKAAGEEQALHTAALLRIQLSFSSSSQSSAATKNNKIIGSSASTGGLSTRPSTRFDSLAASFGIITSCSFRGLNTWESPSIVAEKLGTNISTNVDTDSQHDEDFEDTGDLIIGRGHERRGTDGIFITGVQQWLWVHS